MDTYDKDHSDIWRAEYETEGLSCRAIGKRHSIPERVVYARLQELGVDTSARRSERKIDRAAVRAAHLAGRTPKQLAVDFGTTRRTIYRLLPAAPLVGGIPAAAEPEDENFGAAERY